MHLVEIKETKDQCSQLPPATQLYTSRANDLRSDASMRLRKGQHLDVDGILARSLPNPGATRATGVKTSVLG
jgi:hypothetical protein